MREKNQFETLNMKFFIDRSNLTIDIEKNTKVRGVAWVQGTLEK